MNFPTYWSVAVIASSKEGLLVKSVGGPSVGKTMLVPYEYIDMAQTEVRSAGDVGYLCCHGYVAEDNGWM